MNRINDWRWKIIFFCGLAMASYGSSAPMESSSDHEQPYEIIDPNLAVEVGRFFRQLEHSGAMVSLNTAQINLPTSLSRYVGSGNLLGLVFYYPLQLKERHRVFAGLGYHLGTVQKVLPPAAGYDFQPQGRVNYGDINFSLVSDYILKWKLRLVNEVGFSWQRRSFTIISSNTVLGDDYYAAMGLGSFLRLGFAHRLPYVKDRFDLRGYVGFSKGQPMTTGRLRYDDRRVDINATRTVYALELGYLI